MRAERSLSRPFLGLSAALVALVVSPWFGVLAQDTGNPLPVVASLRADSRQLAPGASTVLRAFARIAPEFRTMAEQIFSWNVDLLVLEPEVAVAEVASLVRPRSDLDPTLGSGGIADGAQIRGIRDSFLKLAGAGLDEEVELFSVTLRAVGSGTCVVRLRAGTFGVEEGPDFLVVPRGDEEPWSGGDYSGAVVTLNVRGGGAATPPRLRWVTGANGNLRIEVEADAGNAVGLEESDEVGAGAMWRLVAQSSAGTSVLSWEITPRAPHRFYRAIRLP